MAWTINIEIITDAFIYGLGQGFNFLYPLHKTKWVKIAEKDKKMKIKKLY
jgi:hypothetical protein